MQKEHMKNRLLIPTLCAFVFIYSCSDIVEQNLSKSSMTGLAPANNTLSTSLNQSFRWDIVTGAINYNLQIAQPNFGNPVTYVLDTNVSKNTFSFALTPGTFQWRVRAQNGGSYSSYVTCNLTIDSSLNIHNQTVLLSSPANNVYVNTFTNTFSWQTLANVQVYLFQIDSAGVISTTKSVSGTSTVYAFRAQGTYTWMVTGDNSVSTSEPSLAYTITVDTTSPLVPIPVFPIADTITAAPIPLKWNTQTSSSPFGETDFCELQISTDSTFSIISTKDTTMSVTANPMIYKFYGAVIKQKYFWRVRALDNATNASSYFKARSIKDN